MIARSKSVGIVQATSSSKSSSIVAAPHPELPACEVVEDVLAEERRVEAAAGATGGPDAAELCEDVVAGRLVDEHVAGGAHRQEQGHVHNLLQPRLTVDRLC